MLNVNRHDNKIDLILLNTLHDLLEVRVDKLERVPLAGDEETVTIDPMRASGDEAPVEAAPDLLGLLLPLRVATSEACTHDDRVLVENSIIDNDARPNRDSVDMESSV